jgi:hypothetical protein
MDKGLVCLDAIRSGGQRGKLLRSGFTVNLGIGLTVNFSRQLDATSLPSDLPSD